MFNSLPTPTNMIAGISPWVNGLLPEFYPLIYYILGFIVLGGLIWLVIALFAGIFKK